MRGAALPLLLVGLAAGEEVISRLERIKLREETRELFYHGYSNYMEHAFPSDVLQPGQCTGAEDWGGISMTLLDTLDTLALMNNASEFERGVRWVIKNIDFDVDETVSLFETNIRALGGLLAAHLMAADHSLGLMSEPYPESESYGGGLLPLALDLGNRLLPALNTESGVPFGSINLRRGVAATESPITCTAAAGTLVLEFGALTRLTGDGRFEAAARRAAVALWSQRSELDLLGAHLSLKTGAWTQADAGIGRGIDSFYEYMLKGSMLFNEPDYLAMFHDSYHAVTPSGARTVANPVPHAPTGQPWRGPLHVSRGC